MYNNYQPGYPPYYHQGGYGIDYEDRVLRQFEEKRRLKKLSVTAGICVIGFIALQFISGIILGITGYYDLYSENTMFANFFNIAVYLVSAFVPFFIAYKSMNPSERECAMRFNAPSSKVMIPVTLVIGLMACTIGNFVTGYLQAFIEAMGYEITAGEFPASTSVSGLFVDIIYIAAIPALVEEFALRGVVMQPLRRYGDAFAVMMSSLVFALMHGNLIQIPFAFIAGIAIGYLVIATGSIWTGVLIHFCNNLYSVVIQYLLVVRPTLAEDFYRVYSIATIIMGICCIAIFYTSQKRHRFNPGTTVMTRGDKTSVYVFTVPMVAAILILIAETAFYVKHVG